MREEGEGTEVRRKGRIKERKKKERRGLREVLGLGRIGEDIRKEFEGGRMKGK